MTLQYALGNADREAKRLQEELDTARRWAEQTYQEKMSLQEDLEEHKQNLEETVRCWRYAEQTVVETSNKVQILEAKLAKKHEEVTATVANFGDIWEDHHLSGPKVADTKKHSSRNTKDLVIITDGMYWKAF
jgi:chromosome segregation ATPase